MSAGPTRADIARARRLLAKFNPAVLEEALALYRKAAHRAGFLDYLRGDLRSLGMPARKADALIAALLERARS